MKQIKQDLVVAYRVLSYLGMDDLTYTHLSARPSNADYFYIYPFGLLFSDVTTDNLLKVSLDGGVLEGREAQYNQTGYVMHGSIYKARPDLNAIFHIHTPYTVAVSAMKDGLLPISQWALHFYNGVSYHAYNSLALDCAGHEKRLTEDLGQNFVMLMRNHGSVTCGKTVQEALFYTYHLEKACHAQCLALQTHQEIIYPSTEICLKANKDLLSFEKNLGERDFLAWRNLLKI